MLDLFFEEAATATSTDATATSATSTAVVNGDTWKNLLDTFLNWCLNTGVKIIIALLIMFISFKLINFFSKRISKKLEKKKADATLSRVLVSAIRISLKVLVLVCLIGYIGIETASISAVIASLGVGISLAVQGTLSNFAGGIIIIIMRPFKLGDYITSNGESGTVEDIRLFYTHVRTNDNRMIYIPNGTLANNVIVNNSVKDTRRVDIVMSVAYSTNTELAKNVLMKVLTNCDKVLKDPAPFVEIGVYNDSSIDFYCRGWCKNADYWDVYFYLLKEYKAALDEAGIEIPFKQVDVNITNKQ